MIAVDHFLRHRLGRRQNTESDQFVSNAVGLVWLYFNNGQVGTMIDMKHLPINHHAGTGSDFQPLLPGDLASTSPR